MPLRMPALSKGVPCLILLSCLGGLFACRKSAAPSPFTTPDPDVYVLGSTGDSIVYWKNGTPVLLAADTPITSASSIFVSGKNVYVCGTTQGSGLLSTPKYWLNGTATALTDTTGSAATSGIFVSGSAVYACGTVFFTSPLTVPYTTHTAPYPTAGNVAVNWKNGVAVPLPTQFYVGDYLGYGSHVYSAYTSGLFASGPDLYIAGGDHEFSPGDTSTYRFAQYWKNGVATDLDHGLVDSNANGVDFPTTTGIFVAAEDVYVCGFETSRYPALTFQALYWKNGIATNLTPGAFNAAAYSIYVDGQDVYAAGYQDINGVSRATYWKNGIPTTIGNNQGPSVANSICVGGNAVYVAGSETVGNNSYSTWWKNGVATHLGTGGNAIGIAIQ
jgi:hypothetical protein